MQVLQRVDATGLQIVERLPPAGTEAIRLGSELIVEESQWAVFFENGEALDLFGPGRHTLATENLPLLTELLAIPSAGMSAFQTAIVFVSTRTFDDLKWGTKEPVIYRDRELPAVRLRAFGTFAVRVGDPEMFVNKVVGTQGLCVTDAIEAYLRDVIVTRLTGTLAEELGSILDLPGLHGELAGKLGTRVADDFARYGLELEDLRVGAITPPAKMQGAIDERTGASVSGADMGTYLQFKATREMGHAAKPSSAPPGPATCSRCDRALVSGAAFCAFCGARLGA